MKKSPDRHFRKSLAALACICVFAVSAGWATASLDPASTSQSAEQAGLRAVEAAAPQFQENGRVAPPVVFQAALVPVPGMSVLFPIIGLIAAVAVTQLLRRRRIAQLRSSSSSGH